MTTTFNNGSLKFVFDAFEEKRLRGEIRDAEATRGRAFCSWYGKKFIVWRKAYAEIHYSEKFSSKKKNSTPLGTFPRTSEGYATAATILEM